MTPDFSLFAFAFFPLLYWINGELPWARGLFARRNRSYRAAFFASLSILNVTTCVGSVLWLQATGRMAAVAGFDVSKLITAAVVLGLAGLLLTLLKPKTAARPSPSADSRSSRWITDLIAPLTRGERRSWVAFCLIAGVCEELLYRGIAISLMISAGWKIPFAIGFSSISFAAIHGRASLTRAGVWHLAFGILLAAAYVWSGSLVTVVVVHTAWNLLLLLRPVALQPRA